jgi:hypothetical protein
MRLHYQLRRPEVGEALEMHRTESWETLAAARETPKEPPAHGLLTCTLEFALHPLREAAVACACLCLSVPVPARCRHPTPSPPRASSPSPRPGADDRIQVHIEWKAL